MDAIIDSYEQGHTYPIDIILDNHRSSCIFEMEINLSHPQKLLLTDAL